MSQPKFLRRVWFFQEGLQIGKRISTFKIKIK